MIKYLAVLFLLSGVAHAQEAETNQKILQEVISLEMCQAIDHNYNEVANNCSYCAHGTTYNSANQECEGKLNVLGKCYGDDHYHAATKQCMYCALGYEFSEEQRKCIPQVP